MAVRREWRESQHWPVLLEILRDAVTAEDEVARLYGSRAIRHVDPSQASTLDLVRSRLLVEPNPNVAAELTNQLAVLANDSPHDVDAIVGEMATTELWQIRFESDDGTADALDPLVHLALWLAIGRQTPKATQLVRAWCSRPVSQSTGKRLFWLIRPWLALPAHRANERGRAFELVRCAARALEEQRAATPPSDATDLYRLADAIMDQLYFASGAFGDQDDNQRVPVPAEEGFAAEAFRVIELLTEFRAPQIVHHMVETLAHVAATDPRTAFLLVEDAVRAGDAYTFDSMAANETVTLIARYLADFRETVAADVDLLNAVRRVLDAFVRVGWPAAVTLSYRLGEAFR